MPFFSTIIPLYNRATLIRRTLDSVLAQEFDDQEVICVDDGSTDGSADVVEEYSGRRVRLIRQQNSGPGVARNTGIRHATGKYIALIDSDDCWFPWTLRVYAQLIRECSEPALLAGNLFYFSREEELRAVRPGPARWDLYPNYFASSHAGLYCGSGQAVIRRDVMAMAGGFTELRVNAEDHDLTMRLGIMPGFARVREPYQIGYRRHPGAITGDLSKTYEGMRYLIGEEQAGRYPGGKERMLERWRILTVHTRPISLALLRHGQHAKACSLYRATFSWNLRLGRLRYLAGFAARAIIARRWKAP